MDPINLDDFETAARESLPQMVYDLLCRNPCDV